MLLLLLFHESIHQKKPHWCWGNEKKKKQLKKNLETRFWRDEVDWVHTGYFNLYPWLCKPSITLSFIMDCEKCDWTGMEKEQDLWSDRSEIRVINICCTAGRLMDDLITSAVSLGLDISTSQKHKCHLYSCNGCLFKCIFFRIMDGNSSNCTCFGAEYNTGHRS